MQQGGQGRRGCKGQSRAVHSETDTAATVASEGTDSRIAGPRPAMLETRMVPSLLLSTRTQRTTRSRARTSGASMWPGSTLGALHSSWKSMQWSPVRPSFRLEEDGSPSTPERPVCDPYGDAFKHPHLGLHGILERPPIRCGEGHEDAQAG